MKAMRSFNNHLFCTVRIQMHREPQINSFRINHYRHAHCSGCCDCKRLRPFHFACCPDLKLVLSNMPPSPPAVSVVRSCWELNTFVGAGLPEAQHLLRCVAESARRKELFGCKQATVNIDNAILILSSSRGGGRGRACPALTTSVAGWRHKY